MNAIPDQSVPAPTPNDWRVIYANVNAWRGECLHHYSAVERSVTKTLLSLDKAKPDGAKILLRHLIGQRLKDLAAAIDPDGPFAKLGKEASKALADYRQEHEKFRTHLCHGSIKVSLLPSGHWQLVLNTLSIRERKAEESQDVIEQSDAEARLKQLKRDSQKLSVVLGQVRKAAEKLDL